MENRILEPGYALLDGLEPTPGKTKVSSPKDTRVFSLASYLYRWGGGGYKVVSTPFPGKYEVALFEDTLHLLKEECGITSWVPIPLEGEEGYEPGNLANHSRIIDRAGPQLDLAMKLGVTHLGGPAYLERWCGGEITTPVEEHQENIAQLRAILLKGRNGLHFGGEALCPREHKINTWSGVVLPVIRRTNSLLGDGDGKDLIMSDDAHDLHVYHDVQNPASKLDYEARVAPVLEACREGLLRVIHRSYPDHRGLIQGQPLECLMNRRFIDVVKATDGPITAIVETFEPDFLQSIGLPGVPTYPQGGIPLIYLRELETMQRLHAQALSELTA